MARQNGWIEVAETGSPGFVDRFAHTLVAGTKKSPHVTASPQLSLPMVGSLSLGSLEFARKDGPSTLRDAIDLRLRQDKDCPGVLLTLDEAQGAPIEELVTLGTTVQHVIRDQDANDLPDAEKKGIALVISCLPSMVDELLDQKVLTFLRRAMREDLTEVPLPDVRNAYVKTVSENGADISLQDATLAAELSEGYPYMIQLVGYYMWQSADRRNSSTIADEDVRQAGSDARLAFQEPVCAPAFARLTEPQRRFVFAMAQDCPASSATADVMARAERSRGWTTKYRSSLIQEHVIMADGRGKVRYAIPLMGNYLQGLLNSGAATLE